MYSFEFQSKLKKLNDSLFVRNDRATRTGKDTSASGIYTWTHRNSGKTHNYNYLTDQATREWMEALDKGLMAEFVCAAPQDWVPEFDTFDFETGKVSARGWRSLLLLLHKKKFISLDKARKVFDCYGLGTDEYDRLDTAKRLEWAKGYRHKTKLAATNLLGLF